MHPIATGMLVLAALSLRPPTKSEIACISRCEAENTGMNCRNADERFLDCPPLGYFDSDDSPHIYQQFIKGGIYKEAIKEPKNLQFFAEVCVATLTSPSNPSGTGFQRYAHLHRFEHITPTLHLSDKPIQLLRSLCSPKQKYFVVWPSGSHESLKALLASYTAR
jgi:hypothetical protein